MNDIKLRRLEAVNFSKGDYIIISGFSTFKDNIFRRLIGKLFPSFDRSRNLNGKYKITSDVSH